MNVRTRITLSDDHPIFLSGLRNLIAAADDLEIVGEAVDGLGAWNVIQEKKPSVAVLDISMPQLNGIALARRLADQLPSVRVMMLTLHEDRAFLKQALEAGVRGYLLKRSAAENLVPAIRAVVVGGIYVDPAIVGRVFDGTPKRKLRLDAATPDLTEREAETLKFAAIGLTNKEIAGRLGIGVKSVETYKARAMEKLELKTRAELVRYASAQGWLESI